MERSTFGSRLREARKAKGLTAPELAKLVDRTKTTIYRYEYELQTPTVDVACTLSSVLGVSLDHLLLGR